VAGGPHIVRVEITSTSGEVFSQSRTVTMVKPGDFEFLDQFVANGRKTGSQIPFEQVQLDGVYIRDKDSQVRATVNLTYEWWSPFQQFKLQSSTLQFVYTPHQHLRDLR